MVERGRLRVAPEAGRAWALRGISPPWARPTRQSPTSTTRWPPIPGRLPPAASTRSSGERSRGRWTPCASWPSGSTATRAAPRPRSPRGSLRCSPSKSIGSRRPCFARLSHPIDFNQTCPAVAHRLECRDRAPSGVPRAAARRCDVPPPVARWGSRSRRSRHGVLARVGERPPRARAASRRGQPPCPRRGRTTRGRAPSQPPLPVGAGGKWVAREGRHGEKSMGWDRRAHRSLAATLRHTCRIREPGNCERGSEFRRIRYPVLFGSPKGIRTPVYAVRGHCPRPLDDGTTGIVDG